jgi:hypothetical protein
MAKKKVQPNPLMGGVPQPKPEKLESVAPKPQTPELKPQSEQTAQQDSLYNGVGFLPGFPGLGNIVGSTPPAGAFYGASEVSGGSPFYNGWGAIATNMFGIPLGTFANYWLMERNPTVALAEAAADAPIKSAEITYECREGTPQEVVDFIREQFSPHERAILDHSVLARSWGFRPFELVFKVNAQGQFVFDKPKPLMPELTQALRDEHGNLVGLINQGVEIDDTRRIAWITYDGKGCNLYGRSRRENCKKPWLREEALYDLLEYSMNIQVRPFGYVEYPYGLKDANGNSLNDQMKTNAMAIAQAMASGQFGLVPNPFAPWMEEMIQKGIDISKIMPYKIGWYDKTGSDGGAGFERLFKITNRGIVSGILVPPRSILEGPGTQADAETHTDTGVQVNEIFLANLCQSWSDGAIDTVLVQNFGEEYRGAVWMKPAPLVDKQLTFNNDLVKQTLAGPIGPALLKRVVALASIFEKAGVKINEFDQEKLVEDMQAEEQERQAMELQGKQPPGKDEPRDASLGVHKFSTTQIQLDENAADEIRNFSASIPAEHLADDGVEKDIHATVKYGLHTDDPESVRHVIAAQSPITYRVGPTSLFPATESAPYDVLKMDVESDDLHNANRRLSDSLAHTTTHPTYRPHVTVAYLKPGMGAKYVGKKLVHADPRTASSILFSSRDGTRTSIPLALKASIADDLFDDVVDTHHRLTPEDRKRRKQFLLALLAFFGGQQMALLSRKSSYVGSIGTFPTADAPAFNEQLADVLSTHMTGAISGFDWGLGETAMEHATPNLKAIATDMAAKINATTAKNIATALQQGKSQEEAVKFVLGKSIESRAGVIEDDMNHVAEQIGESAKAEVAQQELMWETSDDEKVCGDCGPLHGLVAPAGKEFSPGVRWPVTDTHSSCRCRLKAVPR